MKRTTPGYIYMPELVEAVANATPEQIAEFLAFYEALKQCQSGWGGDK